MESVEELGVGDTAAVGAELGVRVQPSCALARAHHGGAFVPLEAPVITAMLELARCTPADSVFDLGCGDARVLTAAVLPPFSAACATGVEANPQVAALAKARIGSVLGPDVRVRVIVGDAADAVLLAEAGISSASVVLLFVAPALMLALAPLLHSLCAPTCRIVAATHAFGPAWRHAEQRVVGGVGGGQLPGGPGAVDGAPLPAGMRRTIRLWLAGDFCPAACTTSSRANLDS